MDLNIKRIEPEVVGRLAEQASHEGMSQQEWIRQVLRRTAARPSPAELEARRATVSPMSEAEFSRLREKLVTRRQAGIERLGAPHRRR